MAISSVSATYSYSSATLTRAAGAASNAKSGTAAGRGDTYTCNVCGKRLPVGVSHEQYYARQTAPAAVSTYKNTGSTTNRGQVFSAPAGKATMPFASSTVTWAR